jgi:outer membrane protein W
VRTKCAVVLLVMFGAVGFAPQVSVAEKSASYLALKGGIYSPSATFNLDNIDLATALEGDTKTGFDGEIAIGHYFLPTLALELGVGYFQAKGSFAAGDVAAPRPQLDFNVIPVIVSAKAFIPAGPLDPYGELGIGAYFTEFNVSDNLNTFDGTTTFGLHVGAGANVNITSSTFIGVEGRYVWADPSFGGRTINLNETEYDLNGFKLNGFTSTLVLGFGF